MKTWRRSEKACCKYLQRNSHTTLLLKTLQKSLMHFHLSSGARRSVQFLVLLAATQSAIHAAHAQQFSLQSPDKRISANLTATPNAALTYSVQFKNQRVILPSNLGITIDGENLGQNAIMRSVGVDERCGRLRAGEKRENLGVGAFQRSARSRKPRGVFHQSQSRWHRRYSEIGRTAAFARRKGRDWFIGVVNGNEARPFPIDLKFLPPGNYRIDKMADVEASNENWNRTQSQVTRRDKFSV